MKKITFAEIYYSDVNEFDYQKHLDSLPQLRKAKVEKYQFEKDKKLCVAAWVLLKKAFLLHKINIDTYQYDVLENGKPLLVDCPLYFSISHSGNYVAIALSNNPIGIDIQQMRGFNEKILKLISNQKDINYYNTQEDKIDAFYNIWTLKEAIFKQNSEQVYSSYKQIEIDYFKINLFTKFNLIKNYKIATTSKEITKICEIFL